QRLASDRFPNGVPGPKSLHPTQWIFSGSVVPSSEPLQVAVARMLGYLWPRQTSSEFPDCPALKPDGLEQYAASDGIVSLSSIKGQPAGEERLRALLAASCGSEWSRKLAAMLAESDCEGASLDDYLRHAFFIQHCELFHQRPFIWHVWDG